MKVIEMMVKPISVAHFSAASNGSIAVFDMPGTYWFPA